MSSPEQGSTLRHNNLDKSILVVNSRKQKALLLDQLIARDSKKFNEGICNQQINHGYLTAK